MAQREARLAEYRARFASWRTGRFVVHEYSNWESGESTWQTPLRYADTNEPVGLEVGNLWPSNSRP